MLFRATPLAFAAIAALCPAAALGQGAPGGTAGPEDVEERIEEMVIVGTRPERYRADETGIGVGFATPLADIPRAIEIIPEQIILDQKTTDLGDVLRNVAGVTLSDGFGGTNDDFLIRGFRRNTIYRNGFRVSSNFKVVVENVERVEVLKGPAAIQFGQVPPGGLVNIVTKKPLPESRYYAEVRYGEFDSFFAQADVSETFFGDELGVRVVASVEDSESFRDFTEIQRQFAYISTAWTPTERFRLGLTYEFRHEERPLDRGFLTLPDPEGGRFIPDLPRNRRLGAPFEEFEVDLHFAEIDASYQINQDWRAVIDLSFETSEANDLQARPLAVAPSPALPPNLPVGQLARRTDGSRDRERNTGFAALQIDGTFETGPFDHHVVFGGQYRQSDEDRFFAVGETDLSLNIFDPVYGGLSPELNVFFPAGQDEEDYGFFIQDQIRWRDSVILLAGLRYDSTKGASRFDGTTTVVPRENAVSPQVGLVYKPIPSLSLYTSYAEGFEPNNGAAFTFDIGAEGAVFDPESSQQIEAGAKALFFDDNLSVTLSVYDIDKENIVALTAEGEPALIGEQSSRGVELTATGQPVRGLNLIATYAFTDAEIEVGSNAGNRPNNVAENTASFWATYEIQSGPARGLGFGAGAFFVGDRFGTNDNDWQMEDFVTVDATLFYYLPLSKLSLGRDTGQLKFQASVQNLFDERFFTGAGADLRFNVGTPQRFTGSITYVF